MQLLVIRHAIAEERETFAATGESDALRPLTTQGRRRMSVGARALARLVPRLDALAASPLTRAQQTAAIVGEAYGGLPVTTTAVLEPERTPTSFLTWLRAQPGERIAVVGHEPHLGVLVTWLLTGVAAPRVPLRKGGACLLDFAAGRRRGAATLAWALTPSQLRRIGR